MQDHLPSENTAHIHATATLRTESHTRTTHMLPLITSHLHDYFTANVLSLWTRKCPLKSVSRLNPESRPDSRWRRSELSRVLLLVMFIEVSK